MRVISLAPLAAAVALVFADLDRAQMTVQSGMTADSHCGKGYCVTAVYMPSSKLVNYTMVVPQTTGWWSVGQGTEMSGANMAIGWINPDGTSATVSHRSAAGHDDPIEASAASLSTFTVDADVSGVRNGMALYSWTMPLPAGSQASSVSHVFAMTPNGPMSSDSNAHLRKHTTTESNIKLDLTKAYDGSAPAGLTAETTTSSSSTSSSSNTVGQKSGESDDERDLTIMSTRLYLAHMIFMIVAWMLCFPVGMLIARYGRTAFSWFPAHRAIQLFGLLLVIVGFFLAVGAVANQGHSHFNNTHERLGLSLMVLLVVQTVLGIASHSIRNRMGSRIVGYVHMPLGVLLVALSVWTVAEGFQEWDWNAPAYAMYIVYAWIAFLAALYLLGFLCLRRERRFNRQWHAERFAKEERRGSSTDMIQSAGEGGRRESA